MIFSSSAKPKKVIKCPGRFGEFRQYLIEDVAPLVLMDRTLITQNDLEEMWDLVRDDIPLSQFDRKFDFNDEYFYNHNDLARKEPPKDFISLVPLFPSTFSFNEILISQYAFNMGNDVFVSANLGKVGERQGNFFASTLGYDVSDIRFPGDENLANYGISSNFGIGTISSGGVGGGGIRSDSPFLFEVYAFDQKHREQNLAMIIGFWAQDNHMLVSQMQSCKNAKGPDEVPLGIGGLVIAETAARKMGFEKIISYSAKSHPIFREHEDSWKQFGNEFVCVWDGSARKLGFTPTQGRSGMYEKKLK